MRAITRSVCAAGLVLMLAAASACGGRAGSTDPGEFPVEESGVTEEVENTEPLDQRIDPIEIP